MIRLINIAHAQTTRTGGILPECATGPAGASNVSCAIDLMIQVSELMLGIVGIIMLATFVYGGVLYVFARGDYGKVEKGTNALKGAIVGLLIVFGAYAGVVFAVDALRGTSTPVGQEFVSCLAPNGGAKNNGAVCGAGGFVCHNGACVAPESIPSSSSTTN